MRKLIVWLHRYMGLALGCVLLISGLSGTAIVFNQEIDVATNADLLRVTPQQVRTPADRLVDKARTAVPEHQPSFVFMPQAPDRAFEVWFRDTSTRAYLDPYTGELLGVRDATSSLMGFLVDLHIHLLAGETGERIAGWVGLGGILVGALGLWLWWPKSGRWKQAFQVKWAAAPARLWLDLHKVVGAVMFVLFALTAATGASLALYEIITEPILIATTGEGARKSPPKSTPITGTKAELASMLDEAASLFPSGQITRIALPGKPEAAVGIRMRLEGEVHQFGRTFVWFDQYSGRMLRVDNALTANLATRIQSWLYPLHTGVYGGMPTRLLQVAVGLSLVTLVLSGAWLWYRGYRSRLVAARRNAALAAMAPRESSLE